MESLKDTRTMITIGNTAALLIIALYFYRRTKALEEESIKNTEEINKLSEHLTSTVKKLRELQHLPKNISTLVNAMKELNVNVGNYSNEIKSLKSIIELQSNQIKELQSRNISTSKIIPDANDHFQYILKTNPTPTVSNSTTPITNDLFNLNNLSSDISDDMSDNMSSDLISFDINNIDSIIKSVKSARNKNIDDKPNNINDFADLGL